MIPMKTSSNLKIKCYQAIALRAVHQTERFANDMLTINDNDVFDVSSKWFTGEAYFHLQVLLIYKTVDFEAPKSRICV